MKISQPQSRADFFATLTLVLLIFAAFVFSRFYHQRWPASEDSSQYQAVIDRFYAEQAWLADSAEAARTARDSLYRHRPKLWSSYVPRHRYRRGGNYDRDTFARPSASSTPFTPTTPRYAVAKVELNDCDTSDIMRIPQFGAKRAQKLVEYRRKLGGFHSFEQLHEIYVLQSMDVRHLEKYFTIDVQKIRKIHVNRATYQQLVAHPYFDAYLAKTILQYREKNGKIQNITEFKQITHAYPELIDKLRPYLSFD